LSTWQDPRIATSIPVPPPVQVQPSLPPAPIVQSRQEADYLARRFEVFRQHKQGAKGPVEAGLETERREYKEMQRAIQMSQEAAMEAKEAIAKYDKDKFEAAQIAMVKARGVLDRMRYQSQMRNTVIPPALHNYQGLTRGYDQNPAYLRPRTYYTDLKPPFMAPNAGPYAGMPPMMTTTTRCKGRFMSMLSGKPQPQMAMNTFAPYPPGVRYKASSVPTPYAIPEFCFSWDMLLRSRRDLSSNQPYYV
jgi:hypothetical protein